MTVRITSRTVTFLHPFNLNATDQVQPAGTYTVETDEELRDASSIPPCRRSATLLRLERTTGRVLTQIVETDPVELAGALQIEYGPDGWGWIINHDRRFWGQENTVEQAKIAAAARLEQTGRPFPRCEIRPFTENEDGGYLISFPGLLGVVASSAMPEEAIRRGRGALDVYWRTMRRAEIPKARG